MMALFTGQLKTKDDGRNESYVIPLLCPLATFKRGLDSLRAKQNEDGGVLHLTNQQVSTKYRSLQTQVGSVFSSLKGAQVKTLRSLYASFVWQCYQSKFNFNATACRILGHRDLHESLHYSSVRLSECTKSFGPLDLQR